MCLLRGSDPQFEDEGKSPHRGIKQSAQGHPAQQDQLSRSQREAGGSCSGGAQGTVCEDLTPPAPLPRVSCAVKGRSPRLTGHSPLSSVQNLQAGLRVPSPGGVHVRSLCVHPTGAAEFSRPGRLPGDVEGSFRGWGLRSAAADCCTGAYGKIIVFFQEKPEVQIFLSNLIFKCWQLMRIYNSSVTAGHTNHTKPQPCWQALSVEPASQIQAPTGPWSDPLGNQG